MRVIEYKGKDYRDDRIFVINLSHGKEGEVPKWILSTYRNTVHIKVYKTNCFDNKEEAVNYLKSIEYEVPLISNHGNPLEIPKDIENKWEYFNEWLKKRNLFSAILGKQHCNFDRDKRGYDYLDDYVSVRYIKQGFDQKFFPDGKVKMEGNYDKGRKEGEWKSYHESGELHIHCFYKDDWIDGIYQRFHENGSLASKGNLIENDQEGEWQYFDEDGNLNEKKVFSGGEEVLN
tara:strand:+ start:1064 stop:1759 length:696 start_codon:yes stop_codon:yes gene_type:complete